MICKVGAALVPGLIFSIWAEGKNLLPLAYKIKAEEEKPKGDMLEG